MIYVYVILFLLLVLLPFWNYFYRIKPIKFYEDFIDVLTTKHKIMEAPLVYLFSEPIDEEDKRNYGVGADGVLMSKEEIQSDYYGMVIFDELRSDGVEYNYSIIPDEIKITGNGRISFGRDKREIRKSVETLTYFKRGPKGWKLVYFGIDIE